MEVFIRRLPNSTTRLDLMQFLSIALKPKWYRLQFAPLGHLVHCEICRIDDPINKLVEYHGIAKIEPPSAAKMIINQLNGEFFKTKQVEVRKFFRRSINRDRRRTSLAQPSQAILEKRKQDRRRPQIHTEFLTAGVTSDSLAIHTHSL
ncbi:RNA-binding protein [Sedimenticola selenatireducens]|uniref:RNA-binding protein n=1 Tax=Sedimenticola selenatireducens TaxID=191960 RepID=A0A557SNK6_9GAMM|nr:RNA-binding protein [Sedimenticola selenatireducens]TVO79004.1 RNA-binding protein [Sedimenticola selenatireducens]TVT67204.1 MAG: RNA-binding protein [Sedimenticola selenatireducens]